MPSQPDPLPPRAAPDLDAIERAARDLIEIDARYAAYTEASPNKHVPLRFLTPEERAPGEALGNEYQRKRFEFTESVRDPATVLALVRAARDAERLRAEVALRRQTHADVLAALGASDDLDGGAEVAVSVAALRARAETAEAALASLTAKVDWLRRNWPRWHEGAPEPTRDPGARD